MFSNLTLEIITFLSLNDLLLIQIFILYLFTSVRVRISQKVIFSFTEII